MYFFGRFGRGGTEFARKYGLDKIKNENISVVVQFCLCFSWLTGVIENPSGRGRWVDWILVSSCHVVYF